MGVQSVPSVLGVLGVSGVPRELGVSAPSSAPRKPASSPGEKRAAAKAIEERIEPDTLAAGRVGSVSQDLDRPAPCRPVSSGVLRTVPVVGSVVVLAVRRRTRRPP